MNEKTKQLAEQAGLKFSKDWGECWTGNAQIERFAELIRQDEREACAKVLEDAIIPDDKYCTAVVNSYAGDIRARSKE